MRAIGVSFRVFLVFGLDILQQFGTCIEKNSLLSLGVVYGFVSDLGKQCFSQARALPPITNFSDNSRRRFLYKAIIYLVIDFIPEIILNVCTSGMFLINSLYL